MGVAQVQIFVGERVGCDPILHLVDRVDVHRGISQRLDAFRTWPQLLCDPGWCVPLVDGDPRSGVCGSHQEVLGPT